MTRRPAAIRLLNQRDIQVAEEHLQDFGFDPGPVDGIYTAHTQEAVCAYQARYGLPMSGLLDYASRLRLIPGLDFQGPNQSREGRRVGFLGREGAMAQPRARQYYRCRCCGHTLPAWLPVPQEPDGEMFPAHLSQGHPVELWPFLDRMRTEDIATVAARAFGGRGETHAFITHSV